MRYEKHKNVLQHYAIYVLNKFKRCVLRGGGCGNSSGKRMMRGRYLTSYSSYSSHTYSRHSPRPLSYRLARLDKLNAARCRGNRAGDKVHHRAPVDTRPSTRPGRSRIYATFHRSLKPGLVPPDDDDDRKSSSTVSIIYYSGRPVV